MSLASAVLLLALAGCTATHRPARIESASSHSTATRYFPLVAGWTWAYSAADGGLERRAAAGPVTFDGRATWAIREWQTALDGTGEEYDVSTVYFVADAAGVSIAGSRHADNAYPDATDTVTYDPPLLYVPADPAATPTFTTAGSVNLVVSDSTGVIQDTTIPWAMAGAVARQTVATPAGSFDSYVITYTPGGAIGFSADVGTVDMGSGRLLQRWTQP